MQIPCLSFEAHRDHLYMYTYLDVILKSINVQDYVVAIPITGDYVSYRYTPDPMRASKRPARYNKAGIDCFYIADSEETARHEVRFNLDQKDLHYVVPHTIYAFDAEKFSADYSFSPALTGAEVDGGYEFCQTLASTLTTNNGLSGVAYPSRQMALSGKVGTCVALLPQTWQLTSGKLEIFEKK